MIALHHKTYETWLVWQVSSKLRLPRMELFLQKCGISLILKIWLSDIWERKKKKHFKESKDIKFKTRIHTHVLLVDYVSYFLPFLTERLRCGSCVVGFDHDLTFSSQNWCRFMYNFLIDSPSFSAEGRCGSGGGRLWGAHRVGARTNFFEIGRGTPARNSLIHSHTW